MTTTPANATVPRQERVERTRAPGPSLERRPRVPFERPITLQFQYFNEFLSEVSSNISANGMFIKTENQKPPGSVFYFEFRLGEELTLIQGKGEVLWIRRETAEAGQAPGMGIQFLELDDISRTYIKRLMAQRTRDREHSFDLRQDEGVEYANASQTRRELEHTMEELEAARADSVAASQAREELEERLRELEDSCAELKQESNGNSGPSSKERQALEQQVTALETHRERSWVELEKARREAADNRVAAQAALAAQEELGDWVRRLEKMLGEAGVELPVGSKKPQAPSSKPSRAGAAFLRPAALLIAGVALGAFLGDLDHYLTGASGPIEKPPELAGSEVRPVWPEEVQQPAAAPSREGWTVPPKGEDAAEAGSLSGPANGVTMGPPAPDTLTREPVSELGVEEPAPLVADSVEGAALRSEAQVGEAMGSWAEAWSARRVEDYLASYSHEFRPANGMSRSDWVALRRERILRSRPTRVTLSDLRVELQGADHATATFVQTYESETFSDQVGKAVSLRFEDGRWKILTEEAQ